MLRFLILTGTTDGATNGDLRSRMQAYGGSLPPFHARIDRTIFLNRMQVGIFSALGDKRLTRSSYSREVGPQ